MTDMPLELRPGFEAGNPETDALARDVGALAKRHGLAGCVLLSFKGDRVRTHFSAAGGAMYRAMDQLSSRMLVAIDNGEFDPTEPS